MKLHLLSSLAILVGWCLPAFAGPLKDASVAHAINDVRVVDEAKRAHPAAPQEVVRDTATVLTGVQSRAELLFPDRTLTRLGAETSLQFRRGTRDLVLERGTLLLQVPRFHGGARVQLGTLTASVGGATVLIEHLPGKSVKVCVLEGDLRMAVSGLLGDSLVLKPGKMLITTPDVRRIPDPVDVDLATLAKTSTLINPGAFLAAAPRHMVALPTESQIGREIGRQAGLVEKKTLFPTNLSIVGSGTSVVIPGAGDLGKSAAETPNETVEPEPEQDSVPRGGIAATRRAIEPDPVAEPLLPRP